MHWRQLLVVIGILLLVGVGFFVRNNNSPSQVNTPSVKPSNETESSSKPIYYYPMTEYEDRLTVRWYGKDVKAEEAKTLPCADPFVGFHTADDLEATKDELNKSVPVFAIADGAIRQVDHVNGYGGLIVLEHSLNRKTVTAYYGHIDTGTTNLKEGDSVRAGEKIAELAAHCSADSSNERKHLHFGIHNDAEIDVRGYVSTTTDLADWLNPKELFARLNAARPSE